ncbi:MAG: RHS repeat-associated core domain-containing protein [Pyrinomonadaceae bacterium]
MRRVENSSRGMFSAAVRRALAATVLGVICAGAAAAQLGTARSVTDSSTPSGIAPGAPAGSFPIGGFENVNAYNGNLNFALPLLTVGGRGEAGYTVTLKIERNWRTVTKRTYTLPGNYHNYQETFSPEPNDWNPIEPGWGPGVLLGRQSRDKHPDPTPFSQTPQCYTLTRLTFISPDGTEFTLRDKYTDGRAHQGLGMEEFARGTVFVTKDGSAATFISEQPIKDIACADTNMEIMLGYRRLRPTGYLMLKNGVRYRVENGLVKWIRDRNGNKVTFQYSGDTLLSATDPAGRTVTFGGVITYKGFGGADRVISVTKVSLKDALRYDIPVKDYTYYDLFPELNGSSQTSGFGGPVVSEVVLPDGRKYKLSYNQYAELARVELPTGGAIEYDYEGGFASPDYPASGVINNQIYRRVVKRRVYPGGGRDNAYSTQTVYGKGNPTSEITYDAAGNRLSDVEHTFNGNPAAFTSPSVQPWYEGGSAGRVAKTEVFSTGGGPRTLLRRVENTYTDYPHTVPVGITNLSTEPRPQDTYLSETKTTLADTNQVTRQKSANDQYGNRIDSWEYDYGSGAAPPYAVRHTHTDYVDDVPYVNADVDPAVGASLRGLPRARQVYAVNTTTGAETLVAKSETRYDEATYPLLQCGTVETPINCSSAPQWDDLGAAPRGNATTSKSWLDTTNSWPETHAQYDRLGNVRFSSDAKQNVSEVSYLDSFCNGPACGGTYTPNTFAFPTANRSPKPDPTGAHGSAAELTSTTVYDFYTGLVYSSTDANGQITTLSYKDAQGDTDPLDRLKAVVRPDGGRTDFDYGDTAGDLYVRTLADLDAGRRTESKQYFDGLGRAYRAATYENSDPAKPWLHADTEYDTLGRVARTSMPYRSAGGATPLTPTGWSNARRTEMEYDALGRVAKVTTMPDGARVRTDYRGSRVLVTDQTDRQRISEIDALGRLREVWEVTPDDSAKYPGIGAVSFNAAPGVPTPAAGYRTIYDYDALGNLRRVKQGDQERFFAYDSMGRLVRAKSPEQAAFTPDPGGGDFAALTDSTSGANNSQWSTGYVYDANGNLTKRIDARGTIATYGYDALNRNVTATYTPGGATAATPAVGHFYDNPAEGANGLGRLWKNETFQSAQTAFDSYDAAGRPQKQTQRFWNGTSWEQAPAYVTSLEYNLAGGITKLTYPSLHSVEYRYDDAGRLGDGGGQPAFKGTLGDGVERTYASQVSYDELGGMRQEKFGTQVPLYHKLHYNPRGQLYDIRLSTVSWANDQWEWNRGALVNYYDRDCQWKASDIYNNGNLQCSEHAVPLNPNAGYTPGAAGAFSSSFQTYTYDALNRLESVSENAYVSGGNPTPAFKQAFKYDRWGNRTIDADATQVYGQNPGYSIPEPQFSVDAQTNRLGVPAGQPGQMTYDPAGNLTTDTYQGGEGGGGSRAYDAEGRMTSAQFLAGQTQTAAYTYDADGLRVKRKAGVAAEVWQIYGMGGELLAEYAAGASSSQPLKEYGYRSGELLVTAEGGASRTNVALASAGATATAQNYTADGVFAGLSFQPAYANDGRRYVSPQGDRYWRDAAGLPTWVQISFAGAKTIGEVDVYTLADYPAYETQSDPTAAQTFTQYGATAFEVQYWTGAAWAAVPGGSVSGNNLLWRKVTFPALTTDKIRVMVSAGVDGVARIAEVEAWEASRVNFAHSSQGGQASASSTTPDTELPGMTFPVNGINNGDRKGTGWEHDGGWRDGTNDAYPDWAQVEFSGEKSIDEVDVFTLQDATSNPSEPTESMTFTQYGVTSFEVQYWTGAAWATVPGGSVSGNNKVWRKFTFPAVVTSKVRVLIHGALAGRSRLVEVEAWGTGAASTTADLRWLVTDHLGTPRMAVDQTGSLSAVSRYDYLPFGEKISAGAGARSTERGYGRIDGDRKRWAHLEHDEETQLDYARARYFATSQGRFTSADTFGGKSYNPQTLNLYAYVLNNPLKWVDPSGHFRQKPRDESGQDEKHGKDENNQIWEVDESGNPTDNPHIFSRESVTLDLRPPDLAASWHDIVPVWNGLRRLVFYNHTGQPERALGSFYSASIDGASLIYGLVGRGGLTAVQLTERGVVRGALGEADVAAGRVLVDSNVVPHLKADPTAAGRILAGEQPVVSYVTRPELRNAVSTGRGLRGVPRNLDSLEVLGTVPSLNTRISIRGMLPAARGRFGDGIIGAQALESQLPLVTNDRALGNAIRALGGTVR